MIPLLFLALGLAAAAFSYEVSPRARAWIDDHARALRTALAAHRAAEAHLSAARRASDPTVAVQHVHEATRANRDAASATVEAAKMAQTETQRASTAGSAADVIVREEKISSTLAELGVGQCDVHTYFGVSPEIKDALLAKLHAEGMTVTGDNPWDIDTHEHDVKLRALWDSGTRTLKLIVTAGKDGFFGLVTCATIWEKIDPVVKGIIGS